MPPGTRNRASEGDRESWNEHRMLVMSNFENLGKENTEIKIKVEENREKARVEAEEIRKEIHTVGQKVGGLKTSARIWGGISGGLPTLILAAIEIWKALRH